MDYIKEKLYQQLAIDYCCKISDIKGCGECKKLKKLHIYECHAGLMEAVAPLT